MLLMGHRAHSPCSVMFSFSEVNHEILYHEIYSFCHLHCCPVWKYPCQGPLHQNYMILYYISYGHLTTVLRPTLKQNCEAILIQSYSNKTGQACQVTKH